MARSPLLFRGHDYHSSHTQAPEPRVSSTLHVPNSIARCQAIPTGETACATTRLAEQSLSLSQRCDTALLRVEARRDETLLRQRRFEDGRDSLWR